MKPPDFVERLAESMLCDCGLWECVPRRKALAFLRATIRACMDTDEDWTGERWKSLWAWAEADESEEQRDA